MKNAVFIIFFLLVGLFYACDPIEEEITRDRSATLTFSTDTVTFDTVLSSVGSITKRLRIFNHNVNAVEISRMYLGSGPLSEYSLTINGREEEHEAENLVILGNDSLLVLVEVTIDPQDKNQPFLVRDSLVIESNGNVYDVKLVSYGQDAIFIIGQVFECNTTLTADRPYVVSGFAVVDTLCTLTVEPGVRILMDNNALIAVKGTLLVQGDTAKPVVIRNIRLDEKLKHVPGQWNGIYFLDGSHDNRVEHAIISNGQIGLAAGNPANKETIDLTVESCIIENMSGTGIFGYNVNITATNNVIYNGGGTLLTNMAGGNYVYHHNTFSNVPSDFSRDDPSVQIANFREIVEGGVVTGAEVNDLRIEMINNILWGNLEEELLVLAYSGTTIDQNIVNNLIWSKSDKWTDGNFVEQNRRLELFKNISEADFRLDSLSLAKDKGAVLNVAFDILDIPRDDKPDLGAYEMQEE